MPKHYHRPTSKHNNESLIKKIIIWGFLLFMIFCATGASLFAFYAAGSPKLTRAKLESVKSSVVYDSNDKPIYTAGVEDRTYIPISKVSKTYLDALISTEDRHFYQNTLGVDPLRIVVAGFRNVTGGETSGASTLTQQLIKLSFFSTDAKDRTIRRKAQEAWLAMQLEQNYTKDQILEFYINKVYFGNSTYGIETASRYYFGKTNNELTLDQTAALAGLSNLPSLQEPYLHPQSFINRRNIVLRAMLNNKKITQSEYQNAVNTDTLGTVVSKTENDKKRSINMAIDPYIKEALAEVKYMGYDPFADGLRIYTHLNSNLQSRAYELVNDDFSSGFPDDKMQVAISVVNSKNGHVIAQIGGRKEPKIQFGLNRAVQTSRSVGSSIKPLLDYAPAIEYLKYSTFEQMKDIPFNYPETNTAVHNWDDNYFGTTSLRVALASSRNVPAVKTLQAVGIPQAVSFVKNLGLDIPKKDQVYSEAINGYFSTLQMAAAYGALANNGVYHQPTYISKIVLPDGRVREFSPKENVAMFPATSYMITDVLKDSFKYGNGEAGITPNIFDAAKTGSTNYDDNEIKKNPALAGKGIAKDNWFNGYSRDYSLSIWTGYDDPIEGGLNYRNQLIAGRIYQKLMNFLYQNKESVDWKKPNNVELVHVLKGVYPPIAVRNGGIPELFLTGTQPKISFPNFNIPQKNPSTKFKNSSEESSSQNNESSDHSISGSSSTSSNYNQSDNDESSSSNSNNSSNSTSSINIPSNTQSSGN